MKNDVVVVTGATGHIGHRAVELLLERKVAVRAVARNTHKLDSLRSRGAETVSADLSDSASTERAFSGARAIFAMIPPNVTAPDVRSEQNRFADSLIRALAATRPAHVVALSSVGAFQGTGMGPVNGLYDFEQKLIALRSNVLVLRPTYFMENLLANVPLIRAQGIAGSALRADVRLPAIATRDIAAVVADVLEQPGSQRHAVRELLGPRDITMADATAAIAKAIRKPDLAYVQFPYDQAYTAMAQAGLSADYARQLVELAQAINQGVFRATQPRGPLTNTPTTVEEFASVFGEILAGAHASGR